MDTASPTRIRIEWLDWVRGIAAVAVMVHHFLEQLSPEYADFSRTTFDMGRAGVVAFFVVSGFVIPISYSRQTTSVFLVRRVTRLFPVYWIVLIATVLLYPKGSWTDPQWWGEILLNGTMMQSLFGKALIGVAWTLTIEWVFYLQQVGARLIRIRTRAWIFGYFWAAIFLGAIAAEHFLGRELPVSFASLLAVASVGHAFSLWYSKELSGAAAGTMSAVVVTVLLGASLLRSDVDPLWPGNLYATSLLGGLLLVAVAYLLRNRLHLKWALWLGSLSYSIYLVQSLVTPLFNMIEGSLAKWILTIGGIAVTILAAWALKVFVERPMIALGRRFKSRTHPK